MLAGGRGARFGGGKLLAPYRGGLVLEGALAAAFAAPVSPAVTWTAQWDSRGAGVGAVSWSIHSQPGPPVAVEDGEFVLEANPANLLTF